MENWDWKIKGLTVIATNKRVSPNDICSYVFTAMNEEDIPNVKERITKEINENGKNKVRGWNTAICGVESRFSKSSGY